MKSSLLCFFAIFSSILNFTMASPQPASTQIHFSDDDIDPNPDTADPYEGYPPLPDGMTAWNQYPPDPLFLSDPEWYNTVGIDMIAQRRIFASHSKSEQVAQALALLDEYPTRGLEIMFQAAVKGKVHVIEALIDVGEKAHPGPVDDESCVPLHAAAYNGRLECVKALVGKGGVDVNARDDMGGTPLMRASWGKHPEMVKWLLEHGADPTIRQDSDVDALEFAAGGGDVDCARLIVDWLGSGATKPFERVKVTPLAIEAATSSGNEEMVRLILERAGYPMEDVDEHGISKKERLSVEQRHDILKALRKVKDVPTFQLLLSYLQRPNAHGDYEYMDFPADTITGLLDRLNHLVTKDNADVFNLLWTISMSSPSLSSLEYDGTTIPKPHFINDLIHSAAKSGAVECLKLLLALPGADIDEPGFKKVGHLYRAAIDKQVEVVRYILEHHQPDLHQGNGLYANGGTALFAAVMSGDKESVRLILRYGGPLESPVGDVIKTKEAKRVIVWAVQAYRAPVTMEPYSDEPLEEVAGTKYVILDVEEEDTEWLQAIEVRRSDEELKKYDRGERDLRPRD
jgi:ankyrin repeat protein